MSPPITFSTHLKVIDTFQQDYLYKTDRTVFLQRLFDKFQAEKESQDLDTREYTSTSSRLRVISASGGTFIPRD